MKSVFNIQVKKKQKNYKVRTGVEISWSQEPKALLNSPAAPSNFCRGPKDILFDIHNTFMKLMKMQLESLEKNNT